MKINKIRVFAAVLLLVFFALFGFEQQIKINASTSQSFRFLRVGLESNFRERGQITINAGLLNIGRLLDGNFYIMGSLASSGDFTVLPNNSAFVRLGYIFTDLNQAQNAALGYTGAVPAFIEGGMWSVYLPANSTEHANQIAAGLGGTAIAPSSRRVSISTEGRILLVSDNTTYNLQVQDPRGTTFLSERQYRGIIEFGRFQNNLLTAVNVIDIEDYLLSVVPAEMPPGWHLEALKAQAVAARTYAVGRYGFFAERGYDVCDTISSQLYLGVSNENENTTYAVNATRGIIMLFNGEPIEAVYFSSSGGFTENSENAWVEAVPYLRSVAEIHEPTALEWTRNLTLSQINSILASRNINIGSVTGIRLGVAQNGRVQEMTFLGANANHTIRSEAIRSFFSPSLESRNFTISQGIVSGTVTPSLPPVSQNIQDSVQQTYVYIQSALSVISVSSGGLQVIGSGGSAVLSGTTVLPSLTPKLTITNEITGTITGTGDNIQLIGRGWGHGVGMSQHGANGMAQQGFDFRQILRHYYTGVEIR